MYIKFGTAVTKGISMTRGIVEGGGLCPLLYLLYAKEVTEQYNKGWGKPGVGFQLARSPTQTAMQRCDNSGGTYMQDALVTVSYADDDNSNATSVEGLRENLRAAERAAAVMSAKLNVGPEKSALMVTLPPVSWQSKDAKVLALSLQAGAATQGQEVGGSTSSSTSSSGVGGGGSGEGMGKLTLQDKDLPQLTAYCLLGVWLDAEQGVLGWNSYHATRKTREWQAATYSFLRSNVKTHSIVVAGARWKQYVRPCMTYACELWAHGGGEDVVIVTENKLLRCVLQAPQDMPVCVLYGMAGELRFTDLCRARRLKFAVKVMGERYEERGPSEAYKEMRRMAELWAKLRSMDASEHKQEQDVAKRRLRLYFNTILEDARVLDRDAAALLREADYPLSAPVDAMQNWEAEWGEWLDDRRSEAEHKAWVKRMGASVKAATLRTATRWLRDTVAESSSLQEVSQLHMYVRAMPCAHLKPSTAQVLRVAARGGLRTVLSHMDWNYNADRHRCPLCGDTAAVEAGVQGRMRTLQHVARDCRVFEQERRRGVATGARHCAGGRRYGSHGTRGGRHDVLEGRDAGDATPLLHAHHWRAVPGRLHGRWHGTVGHGDGSGRWCTRRREAEAAQSVRPTGGGDRPTAHAHSMASARGDREGEDGGWSGLAAAGST